MRRQRNYRIRLRLWLNNGEAVRWPSKWGPVGVARLEDDGTTLQITELRVDRRSLVDNSTALEACTSAGCANWKSRPTSPTAIAAFLSIIPGGAVLTAEVTILEACLPNS